MTKLDNSTINREVLSEEVNTDLIDANMSTYYQEVSINYGESQTGYYNANGEITTGTCNFTMAVLTINYFSIITIMVKKKYLM